MFNKTNVYELRYTKYKMRVCYHTTHDTVLLTLYWSTVALAAATVCSMSFNITQFLLN